MVQLPPLSLALPAIKQAVEQGLLQAQTQKGAIAKYQGPCAIGVILPPDTRSLLDEGSQESAYSIASFFETSEVTVADGDDQDDWIEIQLVHDRWFVGISLSDDFNNERATAIREEFIALIDKLMIKYPLFPSI